MDDGRLTKSSAYDVTPRGRRTHSVAWWGYVDTGYNTLEEITEDYGKLMLLRNLWRTHGSAWWGTVGVLDLVCLVACDCVTQLVLAVVCVAGVWHTLDLWVILAPSCATTTMVPPTGGLSTLTAWMQPLESLGCQVGVHVLLAAPVT